MKKNKTLVLVVGAFVIVVGAIVYFGDGEAQETATNTGGATVEGNASIPINNSEVTTEEQEAVDEVVENEPGDTSAPETGIELNLPPATTDGNIVESNDDVTGTDIEKDPIPEDPPIENSEPVSETQVFNVEGENFSLSIKEIRVKKGDTVVINFESTGGFHDWTINEFGSATKRVSAGEKTSVTFVADAAGVYEYYCSVGSHRAAGMVGTLIVE